MSSDRAIRLAYWTLPREFEHGVGNYGDMLSPYIVARISGRVCDLYDLTCKRRWWSQRAHLMAIGSILRHCGPKSSVWGTGILHRADKFPNARFHAVRGPETLKRVRALGYDCPDVFGDPALLLPFFLDPVVEKTERMGIVPHFMDHDLVSAGAAGRDRVRVVSLLTNDLEQTTREIISCEAIVSSSLHGLIVAHAYGIPAIWVRFSESLAGDGVKFVDYFRSVGITPYEGPTLSPACTRVEITHATRGLPSLPHGGIMEELRDGLIASFPLV